MTIEPYYSDANTTIYHGDCRQVMGDIDSAGVALLLADPPYGMDYKPLRGGVDQSGSLQE